jgi:hypothetical protein
MPAEGVGVNDLVRWLVAQGLRVDGVAHEEQTLESFYLELVRRDGAKGGG